MRARSGISYVEITVVVLILAILAAAAMPKYAEAQVRFRLDMAARRIVADLATAQARARATSSTQSISFKTSAEGNSYSIDGVQDPDRPDKNSSYMVSLGAPPYQVTMSLADFGGAEKLAYNGYGLPLCGGSVVISAGRYTKTITIDADTGIATYP